MKLQYLGDSRDAFKWDLLHWLCTRSIPPFSHLLFVPMLTPDDPVPTDGRTPFERFRTHPRIGSFLKELSTDRSIGGVRKLGVVDSERCFEVIVSPQDRHVPRGESRAEYWSAWSCDGLPGVLAFVDPDNGFETSTQNGEKWVRHAEVEWLLGRLPDSSGVIVYQHRPRRRWANVFDELRRDVRYAAYASAVFEPNLAFVMLTRTETAAQRLDAAARAYVENQRSVQYVSLDLKGQESTAPTLSIKPTTRTCECGCGGNTRRRFVPGHDSILRAWVMRVERRLISLDEIPNLGIRSAVARVLSQRNSSSLAQNIE